MQKISALGFLSIAVFSLTTLAQTVLPAPPPAKTLESDKFEVKVLADKLNMPWSMKVTPDGKYLLFTSRDNGEISQLDLNSNERIVLATVPNVRFTWQAGLLGMDLDQDFLKNRSVYIC